MKHSAEGWFVETRTLIAPGITGTSLVSDCLLVLSQLQFDPEDCYCVLAVQFCKFYLNQHLLDLSSEVCVPVTTCPLLLGPIIGPYLAVCQSVPRTCPSRSKQLLVGNGKESSPEQCCLAILMRFWFFHVKNKWWVQVCRGVGMQTILLTFIVSGLYIKEATNLCRR